MDNPEKSIRAVREYATVRRLFVQIPDTGKESLEAFANQHSLEAAKLRAFRDGNDLSLDPSQVSMIATLVGRSPTGMLGIPDVDDGSGFMDPSATGWYGSWMGMEYSRIAKMRTFAHIDQTRPEAHAALSCWADLAVSGSVADDNKYGGGFQPLIFKGTQAVKAAFAQDAANINQNVFPDDQKWLAFRGLKKYGDQYGEVGLGEVSGRKTINRLRPLHARTMMIHREPDGTYDPNYAYKQVVPGKFEPPLAKFPEWKVVHWADTINWGDLYGQSVLDCELRSWMQMEAMENAMIVRRLERASLRFKHAVDVGMVQDGDEAIKKHLDDYRTRNTKFKAIDQSRNQHMMRISMPPGADVIIGKRDKDSPADVTTLEGDSNIGEITDFKHFLDKWFAGLGPPKAHLGYEDESSKSGINDKHIVFARKVRAGQLKFIKGLNKLYWISMILRGIDPRSAYYIIWPPSLGTKDELLRAQVLLTYSTAISYLAKAFGQSGKMPSAKWFLKYVAGFDDDVIGTLDLEGMMVPVINPTTTGNGDKSDPPSNGPSSAKDHREWENKADFVMANPYIMEKVDHLQFLVEERLLAIHHPSMVERLWLEQQAQTKPFCNEQGSSFREVVQSLGITELRKAI